MVLVRLRKPLSPAARQERPWRELVLGNDVHQRLTAGRRPQASPTLPPSQVTGNTLTLVWTASTPAGLPVTFREALLHHLPVSPAPAAPLPGTGASVTATVPLGNVGRYRRRNACGKSYSNVVSFTVP